MEKNSTINPLFLPLKAFYEKLSLQEYDALNAMHKTALEQELQLLEMLSKLPKVKKEPTQTSIDIVLEYSRAQSKNTVF